MSSKFTSILLKFIYLTLIFQFNECYYKGRRDRVSDRVDYTGSQVIRLVPQNQEQLDYLISLQQNPRVKIWLAPTALEAPVDILIHFSDAQQLDHDLKELDLPGHILINDVGQKISRDRHQVQFFSSLSGENSFFGDFRRYREIRNFLTEKNKQNPGLTSLSTIGNSLEGRPIMCIKIGEQLESANKPVIYIDGGMHAREWAAISTALFIIDHLLGDYEKGDSSVRFLLKNFHFFVVPVVNPDGYEYTHTTDRMWRKNRAKIPGTTCMGTDLNRNYPFHWGGEGSSHDPCEETYAGPQALSEPESTAVTKLILSNKSRMKAYITLHSYGQYFLYPWGYSKENSPNVRELKRVADIGYAALHAVHGTKYSVGSPGQIMYPAQGSDDWAHGGAQIPYVYCLEMRDLGKHGFLLPKSEIIAVGEETYASIKAIAGAIVNTKCTANVCRNVDRRFYRYLGLLTS